MGRNTSTEISSESSRRRSSRSIRSQIWHLTAVMGRIAVGITLLTLSVMALRESRTIRNWIAQFVPSPIKEFFQDAPPSYRDANSDRSVVADAVKETLGPKEARPPSKAAGKRIRIGSTMEDVRAIQGSPTSSTENTWYYGDSEIYFANGRVISWRSSSKQPLKAEQ